MVMNGGWFIIAIPTLFELIAFATEHEGHTSDLPRCRSQLRRDVGSLCTQRTFWVVLHNAEDAEGQKSE